MEIRLANYGDITDIVVFMKSQHQKSIWKDVPFNAALFRKNVREVIKGANGDILLALNRLKAIRGVLIAWHEPMTWTHRKVATDIHFAADQGGDMLLRAFKGWALSKGCSEICMGTFGDPADARVEKLFNRQGLKTMGLAYRMEL